MTLRHALLLSAVAVISLGSLLAYQGERGRADAAAQSAEVQVKQERSLSSRLRHQLAKSRREVRRWRGLHRPTVSEIIGIAAQTYGASPSVMSRIAWCESRFNPRARNASSASGLFQFLDSTWANTPEGRAGFSVWNPFANALAAARHMSRYGTGAWVCA